MWVMRIKSSGWKERRDPERMLQQDYHSAHNLMQEIHHKLLCTPKVAQRLEMLTEDINISGLLEVCPAPTRLCNNISLFKKFNLFGIALVSNIIIFQVYNFMIPQLHTLWCAHHCSSSSVTGYLKACTLFVHLPPFFPSRIDKLL